MRALGRRRARGGAVRVAVAVAGSLLVLAGSGWPATARTATDDVWLAFEGTPAGAQLTTVTSDGTSAVDVVLLTSKGGTVVARSTTATGGMSADFPAYDGSRGGVRAVVVATNRGATDALTPGAGPFTFGSDFKLDSVNRGTSYDNGNNLVQRGLYSDTSQYKLQVDSGKASCRVAGDRGALMVTSSVRIVAGSWYRVTCSREEVATGDRVAIRVLALAADGTRGAVTTSTSAAGTIGTLSFALGTPLSVGGKLVSAGAIADSADQFNGVVDNVRLDIP